MVVLAGATVVLTEAVVGGAMEARAASAAGAFAAARVTTAVDGRKERVVAPVAPVLGAEI